MNRKHSYTISALWPEQIRAARALLDWPRERLAGASGVSLRALVKLERGEIQRPRQVTLTAIHAALSEAGVEFIAQGSAGPGVRFRDPLPARRISQEADREV